MFKSLFTPLRARFDTTARTTSLPAPSPILPVEEPEPEEDFARDARIQMMRTFVEDVKGVRGMTDKMRILAEIHRTMVEEAATKDVFRELDGFLVMMTILSALHEEGQDIVERMEVARLGLAITSLAMLDHPQNRNYFDSRVGFDALTQAITPFAHNPTTLDQTLGFLLSLALSDFSLAGVFQMLRNSVSEIDPNRLTVIHIPQAILAIVHMLVYIPSTDEQLPHNVFKIIERLASYNHRNQAWLNKLGLGTILFDRLYLPDTSPMHAISSQTELVMQKILRKMLSIGAPTKDVRCMFRALVRGKDTSITEGAVLDSRILELLRMSMRVKWPEHFAFGTNGAIEVQSEGGGTGIGTAGWSFMAWISVESFTKSGSFLIFNAAWIIKLGVRSDGKLELWTNAVKEPAILPASVIHKGRWTHICVVQQAPKSVGPPIRVFIDGSLTDTLTWSYPKIDPGNMTYVLGSPSYIAPLAAPMLKVPSTPIPHYSFSLSTSCLLALPLPNVLLRLIHYLGPRYNFHAHMQEHHLGRFLTYGAATSVNIYLFSLATSRELGKSNGEEKDGRALVKAIKSGAGIPEESFVFALSPASVNVGEGSGNAANMVERKGGMSDRKREEIELSLWGDVVTYRPQCLDVGVWEIGGAGILLRVVELANNPHDLCHALGVLTDTLQISWQTSEDMEHIRGYEILAGILRAKSRLLNMAAYEVIFEFLGLNFRTPESSTVMNPLAYRLLALDFEIWSQTRKEIQLAHLEQFTILLRTSRYKRFNLRQHLGKFGMVRKLLWVLQTNMYGHDVIPDVVAALKTVLDQSFGTTDVKPVVAYLAVNLHGSQGSSNNASPTSVISYIDRMTTREKAEQVLDALTSLLSAPGKLEKFTAALPLSRICLLLLGDNPSPVTASHILYIVGLTLTRSSSFNRKFELVSGWAVLRNVLPVAWDPSVHVAAFDVLLGRVTVGMSSHNGLAGSQKIVCPYIFPAILMALDRGLGIVARSDMSNCSDSLHNTHTTVRHGLAVDPAMEVLLEELIDLHSSNNGFRELFKSQQITALLVEACKTFARIINVDQDVRIRATRISEKMAHLVLMLALDNYVDAANKQELLAIIRLVEESSGQDTSMDTSLVPSNTNGHANYARRRSQTTRRSLQIIGDRTYQKSVTRIHEWQKTIARTERKRLRKMFQDLQEHHRQAERLTQWRTGLTMEPGLWSTSVERKWRLDETEGPYRIRKKLEPEQVKILSVKVSEEVSRDVEEPDFESQSVVQVEVPPWAEAYEFSATGANDDEEWAEEVGEDKHRRVRRDLEPGDVIEAVKTATRIIGVDSSPGLLILGKTHLYMLDGLVEGGDGEVIEAKDAPKNLFSVPGSMVELDGIQRAQRWPYEQVAAFGKRTCLFRDVALEIYFRDTRSLLVVFGSKQDRQTIHTRLLAIQAALSVNDPTTPSMLRTPLLNKVSAKLFSGFRDEIYTAQRRWQAREISNFTYLSIINQAAGRTPSDATQYPVFPWVLSNYSSDTIDLQSPETYRDLRKPMGALNPAREEAASARYTSLDAIGEKPFHYGTHFSSSMITCHFLMRLEPFTHMFKRLQGGDWDIPDRLFSDIQRAYRSASEESRGDVRELIPEFFTCPEFLINASNIDFGTQNNGEKIHDVKLPPWAKQDPLLFIIQHRRALESEYVSEHLPAWIDLIWGCKQRDPDAFNVFHPLSYEGSVDLDSISDEIEREATVGIIHNFGQTPRKIFPHPHPPRLLHGIHTLSLGTLHGIEEDHQLLVQCQKPVRELNTPVAYLSVDAFSERVLPCRANMLYVPAFAHEYVSWGWLDQSLRLYSDRKLIQCYEAAFCTCATFPDSETLVTGSQDSKLRIWRLTRRDQTAISLLYILTGHQQPVLSVVASRAWSLVVSGSEDGCAMLWELNRAQYVRKIEHDAPIHSVAINESTGYIATCSREKLCLHTINAHHIVTLNVGGGPPDLRITSLAFHEREWSNLGVLATGTVGGTIALRTWDTNETPEGERAQWQFRTLRTLKCRPADGGFTSMITALRFIGECLYFGQDNGKVYSWDLPE
ncbi:beach-domain-containing protein [Hysterangium stoloniferum]|nr:beach-domain-containing protein [Hysterangium stoloniferum]